MCESLIKKTDKTPSSWWNEASRRYNCLYIESHLDIATSPVYLNDLREGPRSTVPVPDSHCDGAGPCLLSRGNPTALNPTTTVFTLSLVKKIQNFLPPQNWEKDSPLIIMMYLDTSCMVWGNQWVTIYGYFLFFQIYKLRKWYWKICKESGGISRCKCSRPSHSSVKK